MKTLRYIAIREGQTSLEQLGVLTVSSGGGCEWRQSLGLADFSMLRVPERQNTQNKAGM